MSVKIELGIFEDYNEFINNLPDVMKRQLLFILVLFLINCVTESRANDSAESPAF